MNLFEVVPANLFSILNSKNKNIYINALFVLRHAFKQDLIIEKEVLVKQLSSSLSLELIEMDLLDESISDGEKINKDATSLAHFVIRRFKETGWIEPEYGIDTSFKEFIALPPHSIKIINTLYSIVKDDEQGYNTYMYSIYSNLAQADVERKDFMYAALLNAFERTNELENELKSLYHNIRRKYNKLGFLMTVNDVLVDHFDDYQKRVIKQIYLPLKTKDSLNRFKGNIIQILLKWMRNPIIIDQIEKQAFSMKGFKNLDEAKDEIISKIYFVVDKLNELEEMIDKIDSKNKDYVSATTEKMRFLINKDISVKAKMSKLLDKLSEDKEEDFKVFADNLYLNRQAHIEESSLFVRSIPQTYFDIEPLEIEDSLSDEYVSSLTTIFIENINNDYSHKNVVSFIDEKMNNVNELDIEKININNDKELIMAIHSMLKGWDKNIFYRIELGDGRSKVNNYVVPKMKYIRRRKL